MRIYILDEIVANAGSSRAFHSAYMDGYAPNAEERGMLLAGSWQSPPGFMPDEVECTLFYLWTVDGVDGWWKMRLSKRPDGSDDRYDKLAWWQSVSPLVKTRKRVTLSDIG